MPKLTESSSSANLFENINVPPKNVSQFVDQVGSMPIFLYNDIHFISVFIISTGYIRLGLTESSGEMPVSPGGLFIVDSGSPHSLIICFTWFCTIAKSANTIQSVIFQIFIKIISDSVKIFM